MSTDASTYLAPGSVTVTYSGLPGNSKDWIAIAPDASPVTTFTQWVYTNGQGTVGNATAPFSGLAAGTYVARSFLNDGFTLSGESAAFTVTSGSPISTNASTYTTSQTVTVSYSQLPGNQLDWIAVAPSGSSDTSYVSYVYTNGQQSGTAQFSGLAAGSYVARSFLNNQFYKLGESASFSVTAAPSVAPGASSYVSGAAVIANFANLPGSQTDWIAVATPGSANTSYLSYQYTAGAHSGSFQFNGVPQGTYVLRAFSNDTYNLLSQSSTFTVTAGPSISTDASSYTTAQTVTVSYGGLPGNVKDWIAIAPQGSSNTTFTQYVYTNGATTSTAGFSSLPAGTYVARAFSNDSYNLLIQSAAFTVN